MEIVYLSKKLYKEWDRLCLASDDAWFWHTSLWIEYNLAYRPELKPRSVSFMVYEGERLIAGCVLFLETYPGGVSEFSLGGMYCPGPFLANNLPIILRRRALKIIFEKIDAIAGEYGVSRAKLRWDALGKSFIESPYPPYNYLMKFGFIDNSVNTQIIDIRKPLSELWGEIRHGHTSDIKRGLKSFDVVVFDRRAITPKIFKSYIDMHHKAAGRKTRPKRTFDIMFNLIKEGSAVLVGAKQDDVFISFSYFFIYKEGAYLGSSCTDPLSERLPAGHVIQWRAISWLKNRGFKFYEIGRQYFDDILSPDLPTSKEANISYFKRGFGGVTVPVFRGEKYYSEKYFLTMWQSRIDSYVDFLRSDDDV